MRAVVVVVFAVCIATQAHAFKARTPEGAGSAAYTPSCDLPPSIVPANGARDVPRNAHAWITAGTLGDYRLRSGTTERRLTPLTHAPFRIIELPLGELDANTTYSLVYGDDVLSTFTTGAERDTSLPDPPTFIGAEATGYRGVTVELLLTSSRDAAMMELTVHTKSGHYKVVAPEQTLRRFDSDCAQIPLGYDDNLCIDAVEMDAAGNRSAAARRCTTVEVDMYERSRWTALHEGDGSVPAALFLLALTILTAFGMMTFARSGARDAFATGTLRPFDPELARRIAIRQWRNAAAVFAVCIAAVVVIAGALHPNLAAFAGAVPLATAIVSAANARRLHQLIAALRTSGSAQFDGRNHVFVDSRKWLAVYRGELEHVLKAGVPTAKVR